MQALLDGRRQPGHEQHELPGLLTGNLLVPLMGGLDHIAEAIQDPLMVPSKQTRLGSTDPGRNGVVYQTRSWIEPVGGVGQVAVQKRYDP